MVAALRTRASTDFRVPARKTWIVESLRNSSIKLILTRHEQGAAFMPRLTAG